LAELESKVFLQREQMKRKVGAFKSDLRFVHGHFSSDDVFSGCETETSDVFVPRFGESGDVGKLGGNFSEKLFGSVHGLVVIETVVDQHAETRHAIGSSLETMNIKKHWYRIVRCGG
jgi:hypothetical protein